MWLASCNMLAGDGRTYMKVQKDTTWDAFDSLEITWEDSTTHNQGILFQGKPEKLRSINKLPAEGYKGQIVALNYRGFIDDSLVSEVRQIFNPAYPSMVKMDTLKTRYSDSALNTSGKGPNPTVTGFISITLSIFDSANFNIEATIDSGNLAAYAFDFDGDGNTDDSASLTGRADSIRGGYRYHLEIPIRPNYASTVHEEPTSKNKFSLLFYKMNHGRMQDQIKRFLLLKQFI